MKLLISMSMISLYMLSACTLGRKLAFRWWDTWFGWDAASRWERFVYYPVTYMNDNRDTAEVRKALLPLVNWFVRRWGAVPYSQDVVLTHHRYRKIEMQYVWLASCFWLTKALLNVLLIVGVLMASGFAWVGATLSGYRSASANK